MAPNFKKLSIKSSIVFLRPLANNGCIDAPPVITYAQATAA
jgi:hypothetical protein